MCTGVVILDGVRKAHSIQKALMSKVQWRDAGQVGTRHG